MRRSYGRTYGRPRGIGDHQVRARGGDACRCRGSRSDARSAGTRVDLGFASASRAGLSVIDLVVALLALSLLGSLVAMALPSVQEMSRRHACKNNLRVLGLALHAYRDANNVLPPAAIWGSEGIDLPTFLDHKQPRPITLTRQNWVELLLPSLGQDQLAERFDFTVPITDDNNAAARMTQLPVMNCSSDAYNRSDNPYVLRLKDGREIQFARGNYAINAGPEFVPADFGTLANPAPSDNRYAFSERTREFQWWADGVAGINKCFSLKDFSNGDSTTVAIDEVRAGLATIDPRGVWALGQIGGSITLGHGVVGDAGGPNFGGDQEGRGADDILGGPELHGLLGTAFINAERMYCCSHCDENLQATARSKHPGGVQVAMLDAAVRFVSDEIDPSAWHAMHSRETPAALIEGTLVDELTCGKWSEAPHPSGDEAECRKAALPRGGSEKGGREELTKEMKNAIGMRLVRIPSGEFVMALPNKGNAYPFPPDAVPHSVRINRDFYLGAFEVTQSEFQKVMGRNPSWHSYSGQGRRLLAAKKVPHDTSRYPVENVTWAEAVEFCRRLSQYPEEAAVGRVYRLPTEAEWERACRAGASEPIPMNYDVKWVRKTGQIAGQAVENVPRDEITSQVGSYSPNAFGVYDMCGNVYEWVHDYRRLGYYGRSPLDDPQGPSSGYFRVIRGWHWVASGPACKVYVAQEPWTGSRFVGFRVAMDIAGK